jgi:hypothetical protein
MKNDCLNVFILIVIEHQNKRVRFKINYITVINICMTMYKGEG